MGLGGSHHGDELGTSIAGEPSFDGGDLLNAIRIQELTKSFGRGRSKCVAVDGVSLTVPAGIVYGFLGPNGAGKTTTIRCLLGLIRPDAGTCEVLGARIPQDMPKVLNRMGAMVEESPFVPELSARKNLILLAELAGVDDGDVVDRSLRAAGLAQRAESRYRELSQGMKQRLGLAAALLKEPDVLILDEPANGLDPSGVRDVRSLLSSFAASEKTVFLSSHLLSEIETLCDRVAILAQGRCVVEGNVRELLDESGGRRYLVRARPMGRAVDLLEAKGLSVSRAGTDLLVGRLGRAGPSLISRTLADGNVSMSELRPAASTLESVFLSVTEA